MQIKKKALSFLLSAIMGAAMLVALPSTAYAMEPDLVFELWDSNHDVSKARVINIWNFQSYSNIFSIAVSPNPLTFTIGDKYPSYLADPYTPGDDYPSVLAIGDYFALLELDAGGTLINYGQVIVNNYMLRHPGWSTTTITGGAGKVTVSSYEEVYGCQHYLVPSGSLPEYNEKINLKDSIEVTGNGVISGLAVDTYTLYTVYTDSITNPINENYNHGAYRYMSSVTVSLVLPSYRIGSTIYPDLDEALAAVNPGETITLLRDNIERRGLSVATSYTIDLAGYNLFLTGISVTETGNLTITGGDSVTVGFGVDVVGGILSVEADLICDSREGILASEGARVTVSGSIIAMVGEYGVGARDYDTVVYVTGDITTASGQNAVSYAGAKVYITGNLICTDSYLYYPAIDSEFHGYVELNGNIETNGMAILADWDSEVYVKGNIDAGIGEYWLNGDFSSIKAIGSEVSVDGYVSITEALDCNCIDVQSDSNVVIKGDITVEGDRCNAIYANGRSTYSTGKATVSIGGSVSVSGSDNTAVYTEAGGGVTVNGGVTTEGNGSRGVYIYADIGDASVKVGGSVTATGDDVIGIDCFYQGIATVGGNVVASGNNAIGVQVQYSSEVTIEGKITAPTYISFGELTINDVYYNPYTKTAADNDSSSMKPDYMQYSVSYQGEGIFAGDYTDYVWVKNLEIPTPDPGPGPSPGPDPGPGPTPNPNPGTPGTGDFDALLASSLALLLAIMGAGALVVSRRKFARAKR